MVDFFVIGFGRAGANIAKAFYEKTGCEWLVVDLVGTTGADPVAENVFALNKASRPYSNIVSEEEIAIKAADLWRKIDPQIRRNKTVILLAGLGGRTGGPALMDFAGILSNHRASYRVGVTIPFPFEGRARKNIAENQLEKLEKLNPDVVAYKMLEKNDYLTSRSQSLSEYFVCINDFLIQALMQPKSTPV